MLTKGYVTMSDIQSEEDNCKYCGGNCPNDHEHMCDGYSGDIDGLYEETNND